MSWKLIGMLSLMRLLGLQAHMFCHPLQGHYALGRSLSLARQAAEQFFNVSLSRKDNATLPSLLNVVIGHAQTFDDQGVARYLIGSPLMHWQGSQVPHRASEALFADYFGLPADFSSTLATRGRHKQDMVAVQSNVSLDRYVSGLSVRFHIPCMFVKQTLSLKETIHHNGTLFHPAGYMGPTRLEPSSLHQSAVQALMSAHRWGDCFEPLAIGRWKPTSVSSGIGDVRAAITWQKERSTLLPTIYGMHLGVVMPTSNRAQVYDIAPVVRGNGKHWQLFAGINSSWTMRLSEQASLVLEAGAMFEHTYGSDTRRTFDLRIPGRGSRYLLLAQMDTPVINMMTQDPVTHALTAPALQYQHRLVPATHVLTLACRPYQPVAADIHMNVTCSYGPWHIKTGYYGSFHMAEKLRGKESLSSRSAYAIKGSAQLYGFSVPDNVPVPLSVSERQATLYAASSNDKFLNTAVDATEQSFDGMGAPLVQLRAQDAADLGIAVDVVHASAQPVILRDADIDPCSALAPKVFWHNVHMNCTWNGMINNHVEGSVGIGWSIGRTQQDALTHAHLGQWRLWLEGGFTFF